MKPITKKWVSMLLVLALLIGTFWIRPTEVQAATKYVKSFTKTYSLKAQTMYMLPIKVKKDSKISITLTLTSSGKGHTGTDVYFWSDTIYYGEDYQYSLDSSNTKMKIKNAKVFKKLNGDNQYLMFTPYGGDCKVKVKITSKTKNFKVQKLKKLQTFDNSNDYGDDVG